MAKSNKKIDLSTRIIVLIIGIIGAICLVIFGWNVDFEVGILGFPITQYFIAFMLVILSIIFSSLIKSGLLGKWKID